MSGFCLGHGFTDSDLDRWIEDSYYDEDEETEDEEEIENE